MTLGDEIQEPSFDSNLGEPMGGLMQAGYNPESSFGQLNPANGNPLLPPQAQDPSMMFDAAQNLAATPNPNPQTDTAKDLYVLTAADPAGEVSPEERLKQVINAKVEAGILKPFNYVKGYARLQKYMEIQCTSSA